MNIEELKTKYDGKKVNEIEKEIESSRDMSTLAEKEFILALVYLERTNRFKENSRFKTASFSDYIHDRFALTWQKYHSLRLAYVKFEYEVETYGPGKVVQAIKQTGIAGAEKVFKAAKQMEEKKGCPVKQETISNFIVKYRKPRTDFKQKAKVEKEKAIETKQEVLTMAGEREALYEQIEKLKATVKRQQETIMAKDRLIEQLQNRLQMAEGIRDFVGSYPATEMQPALMV